VSAQRIQVEYTKSAEMMADGLTKPLAKGKWDKFLVQLGLVDISEMLKARRLYKLNLEEKLDCLEEIKPLRD